jgi:hypothetical protein
VALEHLPHDVVLADSITAVPDGHTGAVIVCGSHGGLYAAACALELGVPAVLFNDAGGGSDQAGVAGLALLQRHGVAALAVSHRSARIGDAADSWARGRIRVLNQIARTFGAHEGMSVPEGCTLLPRGPRPPTTGLLAEVRHALQVHGAPVRLLDSVALVRPDDVDAIVITGSHGGLLGGNPASAIKHAVFAAFYNDAGVGIDNAGTSRLPALQQRGIAGITVDANSARIGDGMSMWQQGVVSFVNARAQSLGVVPRMTVQTAAQRLAQAWIDRSNEEQA